MDAATRMRYEMITSCNRDVDRMQKELVEAKHEVQRFAHAAKERGCDVSEDLKQAIEAIERMAKKLADKTYGGR